MKVKAKHWVSYNRNFYRGGAVFDIEAADWEMMSKYCDMVEDNAINTARRGRTKKIVEDEEKNFIEDKLISEE